MVSSLSKRWSSTVRILPYASSSAGLLFPIIKKVIQDVEACGLSVHFLCTDNYPMIQLTTTLIDEQAEKWRVVSDNCGTLMWDVLAKLLTATSNCIISNTIKNMNAQLPLKSGVEILEN